MCLAIPGKVLEIQTDDHGVRMGKTNFGGIVKQVCLEYTPEVQLGDYVLVHVGFALQKVDEAEARRTYELLAEMKQLGELETPEAPPGFEGVGTTSQLPEQKQEAEDEDEDENEDEEDEDEEEEAEAEEEEPLAP